MTNWSIALSSCRQMDPSHSEAGPSGGASRSYDPEEYFSSPNFPATNLASTLSRDDIQEIREKYTFPDDCHLYTPKQHHKVYYNPRIPEDHGGVALGVSRPALFCGLRFPLLPLLKKLFREMGIALGQLDPNGFIHINTFAFRCLSHGVTPRTSLFWHHYDFKRNPKNFGFYNISRRPGRGDWCQTNSNTKGSHHQWFFIVLPGLREFSVWREVDPRRIISSTLSEEDQSDYERLCLPLSPENRFSLRTSRDEEWVHQLRGSLVIRAFALVFLSCLPF